MKLNPGKYYLLVLIQAGLLLSSGFWTRSASQDRNNTDSPPLYSSGSGCITLDSNQFKAIELLINDNITLKNVNEKLSENTQLYRTNEILFNSKADSLLKIIDLKEEQITRLEKIPRVELTVHSWKWWHFTLAAIGAVGAGFTAGIIYESLVR